VDFLFVIGPSPAPRISGLARNRRGFAFGMQISKGWKK
jgi:hypothetical protein